MREPKESWKGRLGKDLEVPYWISLLLDFSANMDFGIDLRNVVMGI